MRAVSQKCPVRAAEGGGKGKVDDSVMKSGGTPAFYAPEMLQKGAYHGRPADMWAMGVSLCMMVGGKLPFLADNLPNMFEKIKFDEPAIPDHVSDECADLLRRLLTKDPSQRPPVAALRRDPWVTMMGSMEPLPDQSADLTAEIGDDEFGQGAGLLAAARLAGNLKALKKNSLAEPAKGDKKSSRNLLRGPLSKKNFNSSKDLVGKDGALPKKERKKSIVKQLGLPGLGMGAGSQSSRRLPGGEGAGDGSNVVQSI